MIPVRGMRLIAKLIEAVEAVYDSFQLARLLFCAIGAAGFFIAETMGVPRSLALVSAFCGTLAFPVCCVAFARFTHGDNRASLELDRPRTQPLDEE